MTILRFNQTILKTVFCLIVLSLLVLSLSAQNSPKDEELKDAQKLNQESQAKYYAKLAENSDNVWSSTPVTTLFSVIVILVSVALQNVFLAMIEKKKWERTKTDELEKWKRLQDDEADKRNQEAKAEIRRETRQAAGDVIRKVSSAAQSMTWMLWFADDDVEHFSIKLVEEHDNRMKIIYAELAASQAILASFDKKLYLDTKPLVADIYSFDAGIAIKAKLIDDAEKEKNPEEYYRKVKDLGAWWLKVYNFSKEMPDRFAGILDIQPSESNNNR